MLHACFVCILLEPVVLPEGVLVTDGDRREDDGVVVVDFDVDSHRPRQEVRHTADDLKAKQGTAAEEERQPEEPEVVTTHIAHSTKLSRFLQKSCTI